MSVLTSPAFVTALFALACLLLHTSRFLSMLIENKTLFYAAKPSLLRRLLQGGDPDEYPSDTLARGGRIARRLSLVSQGLLLVCACQFVYVIVVALTRVP